MSPADPIRETTMSEEFWVVGGRYRNLDFAELEDGSGEVEGPFLSYEAAVQSWSKRTASSRSSAATRYSVVMTAPPRRGPPHR
jgi:hypothetical protein